MCVCGCVCFGVQVALKTSPGSGLSVRLDVDTTDHNGDAKRFTLAHLGGRNPDSQPCVVWKCFCFLLVCVLWCTGVILSFCHSVILYLQRFSDVWVARTDVVSGDVGR